MDTGMEGTAREIRLLGPPAVLDDGRPLHVARRKSLALIAYLALHDSRLPRDKLAALLPCRTSFLVISRA